NCVVSSSGGLASRTLPSESYNVRRNCFVPTVQESGWLKLSGAGGRSSNKDFPFFFIQNDRLQAGMFVAVGWSGQWGALVSLNRPRAGTFNVRSKIPGIQIALEPGEEIQGPSMVVGFYRGTSSDGSNRLRRLVSTVYAPQLDGKKFLPPAMFDTW